MTRTKIWANIFGFPPWAEDTALTQLHTYPAEQDRNFQVYHFDVPFS